MDEKYSVRSRAETLDERYKMKEKTIRVATDLGAKSKEVFAEIKRQDPTGFLLIVEKSLIDVGCIVFGFSCKTLEKVAKVVAGEEIGTIHKPEGSPDKLTNPPMNISDKEIEINSIVPKTNDVV